MKYIVITAPHAVANECSICNELLALGAHRLHLRRPGASRAMFRDFIESIYPIYRKRIVLHDHFDLSKEYDCGVHLNHFNRTFTNRPSESTFLSVSCHSWEEIDGIDCNPDAVWLSPIFDSISKEGYRSTFKRDELQEQLNRYSKRNYDLIALGGIDASNCTICARLGFDGVALLGYLWQDPLQAIPRFRELILPKMIAIAGFDPSAGAGITADSKAAEQCNVYCMGVCSAITVQNEELFQSVYWTPKHQILEQLDILLNKHHPHYFKIGLIENSEVLNAVVNTIRQYNPKAYIVWDPILKASAGFTFHDNGFSVKRILEQIDLITPNDIELSMLFHTTNLEVLQMLVRDTKCDILWKGGHKINPHAEDILVQTDQINYNILIRSGNEKHGTGCTYSTVVTALLSKGIPLPEACRYAQRYVSSLRNHNDGKIALHFMNQQYTTLPELKTIPLQYITDPKENLSICDQIELACQGGVRWIQLRMKEADDATFLHAAQLAQMICRRYNALFIINDRVDIAYQINADGVHLGKEDMNPIQAREILGSNKIIGATCNNWDDILLRSTQQVDYIGLGPYTYTATKKKLSPILGLEGFRQLMRKMREYDLTFPVHAIGGIQLEDITPLLQCGVSGIALSGLIKNSPNIPKSCETILHLIQQSGQ